LLHLACSGATVTPAKCNMGTWQPWNVCFSFWPYPTPTPSIMHDRFRTELVNINTCAGCQLKFKPKEDQGSLCTMDTQGDGYSSEESESPLVFFLLNRSARLPVAGSSAMTPLREMRLMRDSKNSSSFAAFSNSLFTARPISTGSKLNAIDTSRP
jgi:hypothetical protein